LMSHYLKNNLVFLSLNQIFNINLSHSFSYLPII
jgi:hypothetical protein